MNTNFFSNEQKREIQEEVKIKSQYLLTNEKEGKVENHLEKY